MSVENPAPGMIVCCCDLKHRRIVEVDLVRWMCHMDDGARYDPEYCLDPALDDGSCHSVYEWPPATCSSCGGALMAYWEAVEEQYNARCDTCRLVLKPDFD